MVYQRCVLGLSHRLIASKLKCACKLGDQGVVLLILHALGSGGCPLNFACSGIDSRQVYLLIKSLIH